MTGKNSYWHIYSDGRKIDFLFRDESEFIAGMNRIALCSMVSGGVKIHAFCLMSNHIHILISGSAESARKFINEYKRLTGIWVRKHRGEKIMGAFDVSMKEVDTIEYLLTTVAYIHRNPMVAGFPYRIECYPWSSAALYFSGDYNDTQSGTGIDFPDSSGDLSQMKIRTSFQSRSQGYRSMECLYIQSVERDMNLHDNPKGNWFPASSTGELKMRKLIGSHKKIPGEWMVRADGLINPGNYISHQSIERKFASQRHYLFVLSRKSEPEINKSLDGDNRVMLSDREIRTITLEMAEKDYSVTRIMDLGTSERLSLASKLKSRYGVPMKQLSRILRITDKSLREII